jgi:GNAT superfamily N-acetyltransferase
MVRMANIKIIQLPPDQWPAYKALRLEALLKAPQAFSSTYEESITRPDSHWEERLRDAAVGETTWMLFAEVDGKLAGLTGAFREEEKDGPIVHIISVYVCEEYRGQGVASALMEAILEAVSRRGDVRKARLGVNPVQAAAMALYRRFGFQKIHTVTAQMGDGKIYQELIMEKDLQHGQTGLEKDA